MDEPESYRDQLTRTIGADEAETLLVSVEIMVHGLSIGDWRRVYKGLWCIHETLRRLSHDDLPDYFYERPRKRQEPRNDQDT